MSPAGTSKDLGAAIRADRKRQNLAQTGPANLCAVSRFLISNLENDRTVIPARPSRRSAILRAPVPSSLRFWPGHKSGARAIVAVASFAA